jgi:type II secretory pathway component PulC
LNFVTIWKEERTASQNKDKKSRMLLNGLHSADIDAQPLAVPANSTQLIIFLIRIMLSPIERSLDLLTTLVD